MKAFLAVVLVSALAATNAVAASASSATTSAPTSMGQANSFSLGAAPATRTAQPAQYAQAVGSQTCHDSDGKVVQCAGGQTESGGGISSGVAAGLIGVGLVGLAIGMSHNSNKPLTDHSLSRP